MPIIYPETTRFAPKPWQLTTNDLLWEMYTEMARRHGHAASSHLARLLAHLLKWRYQPARRSSSWRRSIVDARHQLQALRDQHATVRAMAPEAVARVYTRGRRLASEETRLPLETFPEVCPWDLETQVLHEEFFPEAD